MTEFEKMRSQQLYNFSDPEINVSLEHAKRLCTRLQTVTITDDNYRELIEDLVPGIPEDSVICPPFHCDHGNGLRLGRNVFLNYNCTILDGAYVTIGDNVKIGPNCQIYTPQHPKDHVLRRDTVETAYPVTIGEDTWLGGGVIVLPGVSGDARHSGRQRGRWQSRRRKEESYLAGRQRISGASALILK